MTINITVLTRSAIFVSGDYRLFDETRKTPEPEPSAKAVVIADPGWTGFVTYTGIGRAGKRHTSELLKEWLDDIDTESFDKTVEAIRSKSTDWIASVRPGHPHTFVIAAFPNDVPTAAIVSNFERWHGKQSGKVAHDFFTTRVTCTRNPTAIVTGRSNAIPRQGRRALERKAKRLAHDAARMRRILADANRAAAQIEPDRISPECFVHSQLKDGTGHDEAFGSVLRGTKVCGQLS